MVDDISADSGIVIGDRVALNYGVYVDGSGGVRIGDWTIMGPNVVIVSSAHNFAAPGVPIQDSGKTFAPVTVGRDVWIGANAVILCGIEIGDGSIVGAGSVVTKDVAADSIVGGVPAVVIRGRFDHRTAGLPRQPLTEES